MINDVTLASAPAPIGVYRASFSIPNPSEPAKPPWTNDSAFINICMPLVTFA